MMASRIPKLEISLANEHGRGAVYDVARVIYPGGIVVRRNSRTKEWWKNKPIMGRLPLAKALYEELSATAQRNRITARGRINSLNQFMKWIDANERKLDLSTVIDEVVFFHKSWKTSTRVDRRTTRSQYAVISDMASLCESVLHLPRGLAMSRCGLKKPRRKPKTAEEYQPEEDVFEYGKALLDLSDGLDRDTIFGPLPITVKFRCGKKFESLCGLITHGDLSLINSRYDKYGVKRRATSPAIPTVAGRRVALNLRIEAEMNIFIAQTGMNQSQARHLRRTDFQFQSTIDGYFVTPKLKERRGGEVRFSIYSGYRQIFERYLRFLDDVLPDAKDLFPFVGTPQRPAAEYPMLLRRKFVELGIPQVPNRTLRGVRVNYIRKKIGDAKVSASAAQHTVDTHKRIYAKVSKREAMVEVGGYQVGNASYKMSVGPGACRTPGHADKIDDAAKEAPKPNCKNPAGCLFCKSHKDVDTEDYVWNLMSYRHLKTVELAATKSSRSKRGSHPAERVIQRITKTLLTFSATGHRRNRWVESSLARVEEGGYHPHWALRIMRAQRLS